MTDRDLLEKAARAAGIEFIRVDHVTGFALVRESKNQKSFFWNPLKDDEDAFRLAVKLGIDLKLLGMTCNFKYCSAKAGSIEIEEEAEYTEADPMVAVRRAIVRVAAEMGEKK